MCADVCAQIEEAAARPRETIADVHRFMTDVQPCLEELGTPAAHFNWLYTDITEQVGKRNDARQFKNPEFMVRLDLEFAERYVRAILGWLHADGTALGSWLLVFEPDVELEPIVAAALGVNAHINADLAFALVNTYRALGLKMRRGSKEYKDYRDVNRIFYDAIPGLHDAMQKLDKPEPACSGHTVWTLFDTLEVVVDEVENGFADVLVDTTRRHAWYAARDYLRHCEDEESLRRAEERLDYFASAVGMALSTPVGRGLLVD